MIPEGKPVEDAYTKHIDKDFLSSADLIGQGTVEMTIEKVVSVDEIDFGERKKKKVLLMYFKETPKPLMLISTNARMIAYKFKSNVIKNWLGKKIKLAVQEVKAFGSMKPAVRVVG